MLAQLRVNNISRNSSLKLIENLNLKEKVELMVALTEEIADSVLKKETRKEEDVVYELAGSWKDDRTVDEMIADIHSSRVSNKRLLENLDD
jgi:hypothetical protein